MIQQLEFPFASLDFPGRATLTADELALRLGVTTQHVLDLVEEGELAAIDVKGRGATRRTLRIPLEAWRGFVLRRLTDPACRGDFLHTLPRATLRQLLQELKAHLATLA